MADRKRWLAAGVLVLAAAIVVVAAAVGPLALPAGVEALVAGVAVVAGLFVAPVQEQITKWVTGPGKRHRALLDSTRLHDRKGRLRKVRNCTNPLELGVHRASPPATLPPYVPRDADDNPALANGFAKGGLVIIEGPSASGKTRLAYEAMRRQVPGRDLIVPDNLRSLAELKGSGIRLSNAVVWLDNLDDYLAEGGLDNAVLDFLCPPEQTDVLVLATMRTGARNDLQSRSNLETSIKRAVGEVLNRADVIVLDRALSSAERDRAARERADARIAAALDQHTGAQFAAYLAAAPETLLRWQTGSATPGGALVTAAVDARRAGLHVPLTRDLLAELYPLYQGADADFDAALTWATEPVRGASSCLIPLPSATYQPFDYLLDHAQITPAMPPVPDRAWPVYLRNADLADLTSLADAAYGAGHADISQKALDRAAKEGLANALSNLSALLEALQPAIKTKDAASQVVASGANQFFSLGVINEEAGRAENAEQFYRWAADFGHAEAMKRLSRMLAARGRHGEAEEWRDKAEAAENP